jgi:TRAP-type C4-dicarboxylate transport system permease small subunit
MNNYLNWIDKIIFKWCIILFSFMTVLVIISVILRYLFGISFVQVEGAIINLFIGTTFFGSVIATKDREHIRIDIINHIVPKKVQVFLRIADLLVVIFVQVILVKASLQWISIVGDNLDPSLRIPIKYFYAMAPISFILIIYYRIKIFSNQTK